MSHLRLILAHTLGIRKRNASDGPFNADEIIENRIARRPFAPLSDLPGLSPVHNEPFAKGCLTIAPFESIFPPTRLPRAHVTGPRTRPVQLEFANDFASNNRRA